MFIPPYVFLFCLCARVRLVFVVKATAGKSCEEVTFRYLTFVRASFVQLKLHYALVLL